MPDMTAALRLLHGFGLAVFFITAALACYAFLFTEMGVGWRGRCLWRFGFAVVAASIAMVAGTILMAFARAAGL